MARNKRSDPSAPPGDVGWVIERIEVDLESKASREVVDVMFENSRRTAEEAKALALKALRKAESGHVCHQHTALEQIISTQKELDKMLKLRNYLKLGTLLAFLTVGGGVVASFVEQRSSLQYIQEKLDNTTKIVNTQEEKRQADLERQQKVQQQMMVNAFEQALQRHEERTQNGSEPARRYSRNR